MWTDIIRAEGAKIFGRVFQRKFKNPVPGPPGGSPGGSRTLANYTFITGFLANDRPMAGHSIAFSDYTHFLNTLNKEFDFPNVSSKLLECCKTFRHFFCHGRTHLFCEVDHLK